MASERKSGSDSFMEEGKQKSWSQKVMFKISLNIGVVLGWCHVEANLEVEAEIEKVWVQNPCDKISECMMIWGISW